jgi:hypothetical protein
MVFMFVNQMDIIEENIVNLNMQVNDANYKPKRKSRNRLQMDKHWKPTEQ